jgi:uncharacterized protein (DUF2252 family)
MKAQSKHSPRVATLSPADRRPAADRVAEGRLLRDRVPRTRHAGWRRPPRRRNPVEILIETGKGRLPELLPIRYGRMLQSPFTFYRGAAAIMAADLSTTPTTGIRVQACGDCHLVNFGGFATPERRILFDLNDFDETLPAPWEWDVKRLAASFVVASRSNGFSARDAREAAAACGRSYREHMAELASMRALDVWYRSLDVEALLARLKDDVDRRRARKNVEKARAKSVAEDDFPKLVDVARGAPRIRDNRPLIYHPAEADAKKFEANVEKAFASYHATLSDDRRVLLDRYEIKDFSLKVVGVGSVGTFCGILLMQAGPNDPLFLQVKEARTSVFEPFAGRSAYPNRGQRVVMGQRLMQSASDAFLGWTQGEAGRHFYLRQLRDMKIKPMVEVFSASMMVNYAEICGWVLARAHARSGDAVKIAAYLGKRPRFDKALADFSVAYADQNELDHKALVDAIRSGRVEAAVER